VHCSVRLSVTKYLYAVEEIDALNPCNVARIAKLYTRGGVAVNRLPGEDEAEIRLQPLKD
jgi:hypothetical protein